MYKLEIAKEGLLTELSKLQREPCLLKPVCGVMDMDGSEKMTAFLARASSLGMGINNEGVMERLSGLS
jgi:hypothetical protein